MFHNITTGLLIFSCKSPLLTKLITIFFTALFFIKSVDFAKSDFSDFASGLAALFYFTIMALALHIIINRVSIINFKMMQYFVENQDKTATDEEIDFFLKEAGVAGFKPQLESYLNGLERKPLIKECMIKCMELSKDEMEIDA